MTNIRGSCKKKVQSTKRNRVFKKKLGFFGTKSQHERHTDSVFFDFDSDTACRAGFVVCGCTSAWRGQVHGNRWSTL